MRRVEAAGGVVVHEDRVLLVHRPRYGDWTLPKGKLDRGESFETLPCARCARRPALNCTLGRELASTEYRDNKDRPKVVRYWLMEVEGEPADFEPNDEVDEVRWVALGEAAGELAYDRDREVLQGAS